MCCISEGAHVKNRIVECDIIMHNKSFLHMSTLLLFSLCGSEKVELFVLLSSTYGTSKFKPDFLVEIINTGFN